VLIIREEARMDVHLVLFKKDGSQTAFSLPSNISVIGRRHDCDLCIPLMVVSRRHCELSLNKETVKIRDLDSRHGTFLNGNRINEATVKPGDYIKIGPLTFLLQVDGNPKEIIPPQQTKPQSAPPKTTPTKVPEDEPSGSFPELELDDSDSFLDELEDI